MQLYPLMAGCREQGMSLNRIAAKLNAESILTARGKQGGWTLTAVKNLLARQQGVNDVGESFVP